MDRVGPAGISDVDRTKRGPAMLLILLLSLFVSMPHGPEARAAPAQARADQLDAHGGTWSARSQGTAVKSKKAPQPLAVLPPAPTLVTNASSRPIASAPALEQILLPAHRASAYFARAP